jgi:hypothetical protein
MTVQSNGSRGPFRVIVSDLLKDRMIALHDQAVARGKGTEYLEALRTIYERLRDDPLEFGEPLFSLPAMKVTVRHAAVGFVVVDYGVHQQRAVVFVRSIRLLSD